MANPQQPPNVFLGNMGWPPPPYSPSNASGYSDSPASVPRMPIRGHLLMPPGVLDPPADDSHADVPSGEKETRQRLKPPLITAVVILVIVLAVVAGVLGSKLSNSGGLGGGGSGGNGSGPSTTLPGMPLAPTVSQSTLFPTPTTPSTSVCHGRVCPAVLAAAQFVKPPTAFIFGRGVDRAIWYRTTDGDTWTSDWTSLGGDMASQPGAGSMADGRVEVMAHATNNTVQVKSYQRGAWNGSWAVIGLKTGSAPAVYGCREGDGQLNILVSGDGGWRAYRQYWSQDIYLAGSLSGPPTTWEDHGEILTSAPAWLCKPIRMAMFGYSGTDQVLKMKAFTNSWSGWYSIGGNFRGDPILASRSEVETFTFGVSVNGTLQYYYWTSRNPSAPTKLENLGGAFQTVPQILVSSTDRLDVLIIGTDDRLKHRALIGSVWSPAWEDLGGAFNSTPLVLSLVPNKVTVYGLGINGSLIHRKWTTKPSDHNWADGGDWQTTLGPLTSDFY